MTVRGSSALAAMAMLAADITPSTLTLRPQPTFSTVLGKDDIRSGHGYVKRCGGKRDARKVARRKMAKASRKRNRR